MKLHYVPRTRASRPRWLLEEAGAVHEIARVDVASGSNKQPDYRAVHPHGSVPAFQDDGVTIVESAAICMAIADKFPEKRLAPKPGTRERARYYQWMVYVPATMDPCTSEIVRSRKLPPDQQAHAAVDAKARWKEIVSFIERGLSDNDYLIENEFSAADVMVGSALMTAERNELLGENVTLKEYCNRLRGRPAYQRATKD
jgi:glutathione S-transferase